MIPIQRIRRFATAVMLVVMTAFSARAQSPGTLTGTVRDGEGAPCAGATVQIQGTDVGKFVFAIILCKRYIWTPIFSGNRSTGCPGK